MKVTILGCDSLELKIYSDLMKKSGATVVFFKNFNINDIGVIGESEGVVAYCRSSFEPPVLDSLLEVTKKKCLIACEISDGVDVLSEGTDELSEYEMQAATGLVDTTGFPEQEATFSRVPFIAVSCALYAAVSTLVAWNFRRNVDQGLIVSSSRFLTGLNSLTTFLPAALLGSHPTRIGNQHPASSPWNTYPTKDGWVLICTSKDEQWQRLKEIASFEPLNSHVYQTHDKRIELRKELDKNISEWTSTLTTSKCVQILDGMSVPASAILGLKDLRDEPNLNLRQPAIWDTSKKSSNIQKILPLVSLYRMESLVTEVKEKVFPCKSSQIARDVDSPSLSMPLSGLRVIELGQFTTAPLASRHLVNLGAEVVKIEPLSGEPARQWKPAIDGESYYFTITNSGKVIKKLNLRDSLDIKWLKEKIVNCDVMIENMRPGTLSNLGLSRNELSKVNPDLILCSVSGFGAFSAYPGRGAFDTIIQGMSGMMDQTRSKGFPVKFGISAADILGAQISLLAITSCLCGPKRKRGIFIDVSMQDISYYSSLLAESDDLVEDFQSLNLARTLTRTVFDVTVNENFIDKYLKLISSEKGNMVKTVVLPYKFSKL